MFFTSRYILQAAGLVMLLLSLSSERLFAQLPPHISDGTQVSLLTVYPGDAIYSAFGHSAIRFVDASSGLDVVFNYGTFDPSDPLIFVPQFVNGELDYWLGVSTTDSLLRGAEIEQRTVVEQVLDLSTQDTGRLYENLFLNAQPENRVYRYDFLYRNCATLILDQLEAVQTLVFPEALVRMQDATFRELLQPYINHRPGYDFGIALALGSTVDEPATYRQRSFLPLELMDIFDRAHISDQDDPDSSRPLVDARETLFVAEQPISTRSDRSPVSIILMGVLALALLVLGELRPNTGPKIDRLLFALLGLGGLILFFIWFVSAHTVGRDNWNLLLFFPIHLLAGLVWGWLGKLPRMFYCLLAGSLAMALLVAQPFVIQHLHPALYPIAFLTCWRCFRNVRAPVDPSAG